MSNTMWTLCKNIYYRILGFCKTLKTGEQGTYDFTDFHPVISEKFLEYTANGELDRLKKCKGYDRNQALKCAVENNQIHVAEYLIESGADNLDESLFLACTKNYYDMSELLLKKGAKFVFGLRASRSPNITRMLYRYEQGSEVIM